MASSNSFDMAFRIKQELEKFLRNHVLLRWLNDNKSFFDVLTKASCTTEKDSRLAYKR